MHKPTHRTSIAGGSSTLNSPDHANHQSVDRRHWCFVLRSCVGILRRFIWFIIFFISRHIWERRELINDVLFYRFFSNFPYYPPGNRLLACLRISNVFGQLMLQTGTNRVNFITQKCDLKTPHEFRQQLNRLRVSLFQTTSWVLNRHLWLPNDDERLLYNSESLINDRKARLTRRRYASSSSKITVFI